MRTNKARAEPVPNEMLDQYLWQFGRVYEVSGQRMKIKFDTTESCAQCLAGRGCGAGVFSRLFNNKGAIMAVSKATELNVGQPVRVGVLPKELLKASLWLYGWPLSVFLVTLMVGGSVVETANSALNEWLLLVASLGLGAVALRLAGALRSRIMNPIVIPWSCDREVC